MAVPAALNTCTSYVPATSLGVVNTSCVGDTVDTTAEADGPTRTRASAGMALPVMVTRVPPATVTRVGLIEVSPNGAVGG